MPFLSRALIYLLFLSSGATALVYQVAWTRSLALIFGASYQAIAIVLGSFMAGLALGGFLLGRHSARFARPSRVYGLLELGVAACALALPFLLVLVNRLYVGAAREIGEVNTTLNALRVALAFAVVVLPTFFMGGTLPTLTQLLVRRSADFGSRLSWLYAINTLGAVAGALLAGFVLLPRFGVRETIGIAVGVNVLVALLAIALDARTPAARADAPASTPHDRISERRAPAPAPPASRLALRLAYWGTAVAGFSALALEVFWTRAVSVSAGTTSYAFTVMLAAFLLGIGLGSILHALVPLRRISEPAQFGAVLFLLGVSAGVVSQLIPQLPQLSVTLNHRFYHASNGVRPWTTLLLSFSVMLVPCLLMGVAFPLAAQARTRLRENFGASVGDILGLNTLGCILGSLAAGFLLIPLVGLQKGMLIASGVYAAYGAVVLAAHLWSARPRLRWLAVPAALAVLAGAPAVVAFTPPWDPRMLGAFRNNVIASYLDENGKPDVRASTDLANILYYKEGRCSIVSVIEADGRRTFVVMGKVEASDSLTDLQHEFLLGHLPTLLHPNPKTGLVIGLGAGVTLGGVCAYDSFDKVTLVEIEPAVIGVAQRFADINGDALNDPRLRIIFQDGRNFLLTTNEKFDVITADPIHPWAAGASYLYTTEYFKLAASRLTDGGVMCQWLPLYELSDANIRSILASFAAAFPDVTAWQTAYDVVLVGRLKPAPLDFADLQRRMETPRAAVQLTRAGLGDPLSFLTEFTMDDAGVRAFAAGGRLNTDDNLYLEFSSPLSIGTPETAAIIRKIDANRPSQRSLLSGVAPRFSAEGEAELAFAAYRRAKSETVGLQLAYQQAQRDLTGQAFAPIIERLTRLLSSAPGYTRATSMLSASKARLAAGANRAGRPDIALKLGDEALALDPTNSLAAMERATAFLNSGRAEEAVALLRDLRTIRPLDSNVFLSLAAACFSAGKPDDAAATLRELLALEPENAQAHHNLAVALAGADKRDEALAQFAAAVRLSPRNPEFRADYAVMLAKAGRHAKAIAALRPGLRAQPDNPRLNARLAWLLSTAPDGALRDKDEALRRATLAATATNNAVPQALDILAAAQAENARFGEAATTARRAAALAQQQGDAAGAAAIRARLAEYEAGKPHRE